MLVHLGLLSLLVPTPPLPRAGAGGIKAAAPREGKYVLGLNQYSHDAGCALLSLDGSVAVVVPKERVSRVKCDGGSVASAVEAALSHAGASASDLALVVANNHHFRISEFENALPWRVALGLQPNDSLHPLNLLPGVPKLELSHHLAHAWSVVASAPFSEGLIVIMDGMGEAADAAALADVTGDEAYFHDARVPADAELGFQQVPAALSPHLRYREAESVYMLRREPVSGAPRGADSGVSISGEAISGEAVSGAQRGAISGGALSGGTVLGAPRLTRVFKRWVPHRSPPELYNHGFESMESLGALYSRISSHIFSDWNACGKVMGLAPWAEAWDKAATAATAVMPPPVDDAEKGPQLRAGSSGAEPGSASSPTSRAEGLSEDSSKQHGAYTIPPPPLTSGHLDGLGDDALCLFWDQLHTLPDPGGWKRLPPYSQRDMEGDPRSAAQQARLQHARLASRVQTDLERQVLEFLFRLKARTGVANLGFAGGVALNSVLNGRISRDLGLEQFYVPPWPGDEGIALGCAAFALHTATASRQAGDAEGIGLQMVDRQAGGDAGDVGAAARGAPPGKRNAGDAVASADAAPSEGGVTLGSSGLSGQASREIVAEQTVIRTSSQAAIAMAEQTDRQTSGQISTAACTVRTVPQLRASSCPPSFPLASCARGPYLGGDVTAADVQAAIDELQSWLEVVEPSSLTGDQSDDHADNESDDSPAVFQAEMSQRRETAVGSSRRRPSKRGKRRAEGSRAQSAEQRVSPPPVILPETSKGSQVDDSALSPSVVCALAAALVAGEVVGICRGRSEVGPRALGHRSILADPRRADMHARANVIKQRELFRPLAPAVLAEHADAWFQSVDGEASPYMSLTAFARGEVAEQIPAVVHVDGSARLQTVDGGRFPFFHALLSAFLALTGIPLLMNTSFNLANAPIVETPADAARCFLDADPDFSLLLLGNTLLRRRTLPTPLPQDAIPVQQAAIVSRTVADGTGEAGSVEILVVDKWLPLSTPFVLAVLEACDGTNTVGEIAGEIAAMQAEAEAETAVRAEAGWPAGMEVEGFEWEGTEDDGMEGEGVEGQGVEWEGMEEGMEWEGDGTGSEVAGTVDQALRELYRLRLVSLECGD